MSYFVGHEIRNYGTFQTADGTAYDPGTVRIGIQQPEKFHGQSRKCFEQPK